VRRLSQRCTDCSPEHLANGRSGVIILGESALHTSQGDLTREGPMPATDAYAQPEQLIAALNRSRHWKLFGAVGGLVLALGVLFAAAIAMYSEDSSAPPAPAAAK
jgi:hypothetical protein